MISDERFIQLESRLIRLEQLIARLDIKDNTNDVREEERRLVTAIATENRRYAQESTSIGDATNPWYPFGSQPEYEADLAGQRWQDEMNRKFRLGLPT